jgi:formamidopyrimidine-DNA glycosylase
VPELPEVETIVRSLNQGLPMDGELPGFPTPVGCAIVGVWSDWPKAALPSFKALERGVVEQGIVSITRRAKYIVISLERGCLLVHLKMSGRLVVQPAVEARARHVHFEFLLDNGWGLRFADARKFGRVRLADDAEEALAGLGPEPLGPSFSLAAFRKLLAGRKGALKPLLLDQSFIAGIGNIYADEALFRAGLHPRRRAAGLSPDEVAGLYRGIRSALRDGIRHDGASFDWVYPGGEFQNHFKAYGRAGKPCARCGTALRRILVAQRGTCFCPICQPPA